MTDDTYDAVVAVVIDGRLCTGAMVSPRVVVTAAHCLPQSPSEPSITVHWGRDVTEERSVAAREWGTHPDYCEACAEDRFDFAFVELAAAVPNARLATPMTSQRQFDDALFEGARVSLVGYGDDESRAGPSSGTKRVVDTAVSRFSAAGTEFVAGGAGRDTCSGDSGGPAFVRLADGSLRWVGVTSRGGVPCGSGGFYGIPDAAQCWLAERTGVDLGTPGCGTCECLVLPKGAEEGCNSAGRPSSPWTLVGLVALWAAGVRRRC